MRPAPPARSECQARLARRLLAYLRPYRGSVVLALVLTILVGPLEIVGPYLFGYGVDQYIVPASGGFIPLPTALRGLQFIVLGFLAALVLSFAVQYLQARIMQYVGQRTLYDLRKDIFEHLQRLPVSFYDRSPVGRLVTRATTDVDALNDLFAAGIAAMANDAVVLAWIGAVMLKMNWRLALATFGVLPLIGVATWLFRGRVREANRRIRTAIARINAFLQEHISGMSVVQLFNRERKARDQFAVFNRLHMEAYKDAILAFALFYPAVELLSMAAIGVVFWYGGLQSFAGFVKVGVLITFMQYAQRLLSTKPALASSSSRIARELVYESDKTAVKIPARAAGGRRAPRELRDRGPASGIGHSDVSPEIDGTPKLE